MCKIKGLVEPSMFKSLDYEVLKNNLEYTFNPYKRYGTNKIEFEVIGDFEAIQKFTSKWNELIKVDNSKPTQAQYSFFDKFKFAIGSFLQFGFLPIAKITNKGQAELYTLYNNGIVKIKSINDKTTDVVLINMCSKELISEFKVAVDKT